MSIGIGQRRIVDLQNETGVHDGLVLGPHGVGQRENVFLVGCVVFVQEEVLQPARRQNAHEGLRRFRARFNKRRAHGFQIFLNFRLACERDRAGNDGTRFRGREERHFLVELVEFEPLAGLERHIRGFARLQLSGGKAA